MKQLYCASGDDRSETLVTIAIKHDTMVFYGCQGALVVELTVTPN